MENKKKRIRQILIVSVSILIILIVSICLLSVSKERKQQESIQIIKDMYGLDVSAYPFTYNSTLHPLWEGGELIVRVSLEQDIAEQWEQQLKECGISEGLREDYLPYHVKKRFDLKQDMNGNAYLMYGYGSARDVWLKSGYVGYQQDLISYFHKNPDDTVTVYFSYMEADANATFMYTKKLLILIVILLILCFVIKKVYTEKPLQKRQIIRIVKKEFDINIAKTSFEFKNTLKLYASKGSVKVKCDVNKELLQTINRRYDLKWLYGASYEAAQRKLAEAFEIESAAITGKIVMPDSEKGKKTLFGSTENCARILCLQEKQGANYLYLLYEVNR